MTLSEISDEIVKNGISQIVVFSAPIIIGLFVFWRRWLFGQKTGLNVPSEPTPAARITLGILTGFIGSILAIAISILIAMYSNTYSVSVKNETVNRAIGGVYQNKTGGTLIVTVTAFRPGAGNTIHGSISVSLNSLPTGRDSGGNATTVVAAAFVNKDFTSNITFVVPKDYFYEVSTDGGNASILYWTETTF